MKEAYYIHGNTVIVNYSKKYITGKYDILKTEVFDGFLDRFLDHLKDTHGHHYQLLNRYGNDRNEVKSEILKLLRSILIADEKEIPEITDDREGLLDIVEAGYNYWRSFERYSVLYTSNEEGFQIQNFIDADSRVNSHALEFYREIEQKLQGSNTRVFRQLKAGTNAAMLLSYYDWKIPEGYEELKGIPFINEILLRTPLILHPSHNKRTNTFTEADHDLMKDFVKGTEEWVCFPAKVGELLIFCYFHRDYVTSAVGMANLFELASKQEVLEKSPDAILLFGNKDGKKDTSFSYDEKNDIWTGKNSAEPEIDYFGYTKKSVLTLHNLTMMKKGWLPIHGAMVNVYLKDGRKKGLMFMGDSGAGKSETLEALSEIAAEYIDHQEVIFDDMGTLHIDEEGRIKGEGTEIGAFVRLDDLDKGTAYRDMERSIFFNPEKANARVVLPASPYKTIVTPQDVDVFLYANNYEDKRGIKLFEKKEDAVKVFTEGKRNALGTTQEKGLSCTFFANPFGPMQKKEECLPLIDRIFAKLYEQKIPVGEMYTCLGLPDKGGNGIQKTAEELLDYLFQK